jgi:hypothetical protein
MGAARENALLPAERFANLDATLSDGETTNFPAV